MKRHPRNTRGFTLAEIVVVATVLGLLTALVMPFFVSLTRLSYKTSSVLYNTDALRQISTGFAGDVQSAATMDLILPDNTRAATLVDASANHVQMIYTNPQTNQVRRIIGYYLDVSAGGVGPWPLRRYQVDNAVAPDLSVAAVRDSHEIIVRARPFNANPITNTVGTLFFRQANMRAVFVSGNVITATASRDRGGASQSMNSLNFVVGLR
jgi:prepilin-type N-terminal cleavage/methylation domain-containing protein